MADAFEKRHGLKLPVVLFCVWAISFTCLYPRRMFLEKSKQAKLEIFFNNLTNLHFRGYRLTPLALDEIAEEALQYSADLGRDSPFTRDEVREGFQFLLLTPESQKLIGLWSGGRCPLLVPHGDDALIINLAGVIPLLTRLFVGVRDLTGAKGGQFEESVRQILGTNALQIVFSGELHWHDGRVREVDAAVRINDCLVLVECFSFELPLDYELAKPAVFECRKARLAEKLEQAKSLWQSVSEQPVGRNFDFSWTSTVEWRLVSPFVEFAWELTDDFFDEAGVARIMNVDELVRYLKDSVPPAPALVAPIQQFRQKGLR